jgi:hypothetical protein
MYVARWGALTATTADARKTTGATRDRTIGRWVLATDSPGLIKLGRRATRIKPT